MSPGLEDLTNAQRIAFRLEVAMADNLLTREMRQAFQNHWAEAPRPTSVDLALVRYMDSASIAVLLDMAKELKDKGMRLEIGAISGELRHFFEVSYLDRVFQFPPKP